MTLRNLLPAALWLGFALGAGTAFLRHGSWLSLGMGGVNLLIATLFLIRRPEASEGFRPVQSALAWVGTFLPFLFRPEGTVSPASLALQALGILGIVLSLRSLGRNFGLSPARREVVTRGPYRWVRHPLYTAELTYFLGIVLASPSPWNLALWGALVLIQGTRARNEERCLEQDAAYQAYRGAVPHRFLPRLL